MGRLIDSDDVKELINSLESLPFEEDIDYLVDSIPTAYDVEKVIAEIERSKRRIVDELENLLHLGRYRAYNDAIYIMRNGKREQ